MAGTDDRRPQVERRALVVVVAIVSWASPAVAVPEPCAYADATARQIHPSEVYRADDLVGTELARVRERISPACRKAPEAGQWPELAELIRRLLSASTRYRTQHACWRHPSCSPTSPTG